MSQGQELDARLNSKVLLVNLNRERIEISEEMKLRQQQIVSRYENLDQGHPNSTTH